MSHPPATILVNSPVGTIELVAEEGCLTSLKIMPGAKLSDDTADDPVLVETVKQLDEYFGGKRENFDVSLAPLSTARGEALRAGIASIPYGETLTYGMLAKVIESAPRAVGQACRRNPFPIIIPCHRVTSANGAPEHYSGGDGINTKSWLNAFEAKNKES